MIDTSALTPASQKKNLQWRDPSLTLIWIRADGPAEVAYKLVDKRRAVDGFGPSDTLLAVRQVQYPNRQQVLVVDNLDAVRAALGAG